ncbi:STAS domain-containing protein [Streptomyces xanthochromogenes]|uniref:STAS domain-containing protein n=1 Tax=Streptomyces xanthochromogenes TaxID=67384 RepID=UPI0034393832
MTTPLPSDHLRLTTVDTEGRVRIEVQGDLDHDSADLLLEETMLQLGSRPDIQHLHLHCAELGIIDSIGMSTLLMIHRRTTAAGVRLHLDERPANLNRILRTTGTLDFFIAAQPAADFPEASTHDHHTATRSTEADST